MPNELSAINLTGQKNVGKDTLVTATWKVYSVTNLGLLLEKEASIRITESVFGALCTLNVIVTCPPWMIRSLAAGKLALSSGRAELKFHSSSAEAPLDCCCGWEGGSKPRMEGGGVETEGCDRSALSEGEDC